LPFDEVMRVALYDPDHGFYATGGAAGRRGDFITSVEVGPLFGAVVGRALDSWWRELGRPDPFVVIEAGAGSGMLARSVLRSSPDCLPALTYVLVEQSAALRARHGEHLPMTAASHALPPVNDDEDAASAARPDGAPEDTATGPRFVSLPDVPIGPFTGVVLANELLDNLPVKLLVHHDAAGWREVRVGLTADEGGVAEYLVPADASLRATAERLVPDAGDGARVPIQLVAGEWVRDAVGALARGRVVLIDYADSTPSMAARASHEWLRTYRDHARGAPPLEDLGLQDITCEVAIDQIARVRPGLEVEAQADFLRRHGIDALVEEGRRIWHERGAVGDLAAIEGRSRVNEAAALLDPDGLGAFTVLTWTI
jgi:SAM-dependent MidA family methyltransferase